MSRGGNRWGAGRPGWHAKAEHCLRLDVRTLAQRNCLGGSYTWRWTNTDTGETAGSIGITASEHGLRLDYNSAGKPVCERIDLERTACNYGGTRPWFRCPQCHVRAGVLFLRSGRFRCRGCSEVAYSSQSEDAMGRAWRLQRKLERRLGEGYQRLKGMHHATQQRIFDRIMDCEQARDEALCLYVARFTALGLLP